MGREGGPGHTAEASGQLELEVCFLGDASAAPWPRFAASALRLVGPASMYAVPMRPDDAVLGVLTLYRLRDPGTPLALDAFAVLEAHAYAGDTTARGEQA